MFLDPGGEGDLDLSLAEVKGVSMSVDIGSGLVLTDFRLLLDEGVVHFLTDADDLE